MKAQSESRADYCVSPPADTGDGIIREALAILDRRLRVPDHENTNKALQCSIQLTADIRAILATDNVLLSDAAIELIALSMQIQQRLGRMEFAVRL